MKKKYLLMLEVRLLLKNITFLLLLKKNVKFSLKLTKNKVWIARSFMSKIIAECKTNDSKDFVVIKSFS